VRSKPWMPEIRTFHFCSHEGAPTIDPMTTTPDGAGLIELAPGTLVSRLGFGAIRITGQGIWGEPRDSTECLSVLRRAIELGVRFIDTADSYGPDVSEDLIRAALHPYPNDLVVATKAGWQRPGPGEWVADGRPEHLREACEGSLRRLGVERLALLQLHTPDPDVPVAESVGALHDLHAEGKVDLIGVSNVSVAQLEVAISVTAIATVQNRFNYADDSSADVLLAAEANDIVFIPWAPSGGRNVGQGAVLHEIAERYSATPVQVALAWALARSPRILPIPGTSSVEHLEENLAAGELRLDDSDVALLTQSGGA
jgi:pyridoxine 4-dehydrogenase